MAGLRAMLQEWRGETSVEDWVYDINGTLQPEPKKRMRVATLYSYLNGQRPITGRGAKLLAQYFYAKKELKIVSAISEIALGIPYPLPDSGNGNHTD